MSEVTHPLFAELVEDDTDPHTPIFWEAVHALAKRGADITIPEVGFEDFTLAEDYEVPDLGLGARMLEVQRLLAIKTPTQMMEIIEVG